jgi:hypothetical protein
LVEASVDGVRAHMNGNGTPPHPDHAVRAHMNGNGTTPTDRTGNDRHAQARNPEVCRVEAPDDLRG